MLKIGIIGTGSMGGRYANEFKTFDDVSIVQCNTHGGNGIYCDWRKMIDDGLDGIIVAADPRINLTVCQYANVPVLLEKPASLFLEDVYKMEKLKHPILVDYIHLFNPQFQLVCDNIKSPITRIVSLGYNHGPFRKFNSFFDFAPHDLSMIAHLCKDKIEILDVKARVGDNSGTLYVLHLQSGETEIHVMCGNGGNEKVRKLALSCKDGNHLIYDDKGQSKLPLNNVCHHFLEVVKGIKPNPSFDLTVRIHKLMYDIGKAYDKRPRN